MEERNFKWLLKEFDTKRARLNMLDIINCSNGLVKCWYNKDQSGNFKATTEPNHLKIKHLLLQLLDERSPKLQSFTPDRVQCVIYQRGRVRALTSEAILQIPSSRVCSMRISSIHILPAQSVSVLISKAEYTNKIGNISCTFKKENKQPGFPKIDVSKIITELGISLADFIYRATGNTVQRMNFDVIVDNEGVAYLLKTHKILLSSRAVNRNNHKQKNTNYPSVEVFNVAPATKQRHITYKNFEKKGECENGEKWGNVEFIEMMAKTIERKRRSEMGKSKSGVLLLQSQDIGTMNELLEEMANTSAWKRAQDPFKKKQRVLPHLRQLSGQVSERKEPIFVGNKLNMYKRDAALRNRYSEKHMSNRQLNVDSGFLTNR